MGEALEFSVKNNVIHLNGEEYQQLSFVDLCAGFADRLLHWRVQAYQRKESEKTIAASMAVDLTPCSPLVHQMDALEFLRTLPSRSIQTLNSEYPNLSGNPKDRLKKDKTHLGIPTLMYHVDRVLQKDGEFHLTLPFRYIQEIDNAVRKVRMKLQPIAMGYMGFLGGKNRWFPEEGLPAVEGISYHVRSNLKHVYEIEEHPDKYPFEAYFSERIGEYRYIPDNPIHFKITHAHRK